MISPAFQRISGQARPYPSYLLPRGGTALSLFGAGFHGWNDVIHMARKEMEITCVDVDGGKLAEMADIYDRFIGVEEDAWKFAENATREGNYWDVVSVDPFFGDAAERAWETLYLWTGLAASAVTLTVKSDTQLNIPEPWTSSYYPRSGDAAWLVLRRD
jgi:hypothetical protein